MATEHPFNWIDTTFHSNLRQILTFEDLQIPGLSMFGKHTLNNAAAPLPSHYHKDCFEITLVTHGAISFTVSDAEYELSGYDVFITYPNEVHSTNFLPLAVGEIIWFQLDMNHLKNCLFLSDEAITHLIDELYLIKKHKITTKNTQISYYMKHAFALATDPSNKFLVAGFLYITLSELLSLAYKPVSETTPDITKVLTYIKENIYEPLTLDELAEISNLSTSQFKQKFRSQTGIAPRNYINHMKVKQAKKMLESGTSITDTAMELGFDTSSYFSVVFKRYTAISPREYLKRKAKESYSD